MLPIVRNFPTNHRLHPTFLPVILDTPVILNGVKDHFVKRFFAYAQNDGLHPHVPFSRPRSPSAGDHAGRSGVAPLPARLRGTSTAKP